jgi:hypothetical protein
LIRQRPGQNKETFVAFFQNRKIPSLILYAVYDYFQGLMGEDFPVLPKDKIADLSNDFDLEIQGLVKKCGRKLPAKHRYEDTIQLDTVEELVVFLAACPSAKSVIP